MTDATPADHVEGTQRSYDGLPGAFVYAVRTSESWLFKGYVLLALLLTVAIALVFVFGLISILAQTSTVRGGTFTFSRSFFLFVGLLVVAPLLAPVLLVARRHRRSVSSVTYDRGLALSALLFVASLYVGLVVSVPPQLQEPTGSSIVTALYELPQIAGLVPPLVAVGVMYAVHRLLR
ncbi:hypothetical protein [Haloarcula pellucida]|uniref:DUF8056 domain-containing protein n=1 Tax=Haloarcula pellucida TaxID=1427151 RepID=A0A830GMI8_9EURY|nr:hypothetical protein [Halomicroarcula pellucida]MBX0348781.1 hypothetical protein [Halomicroarcula pellucida]GGN91835.1 hypothetical protein GCM10009030_15280 [Halomicroarcula pellucida]